VASAVMIALLPSYGLMTKAFPGVWRGAWPHKNILGYDMAVAFVVFAAAAIHSPRRRVLWAAMAAASIVFVVMSQSMTSIISWVIAAGVMGLVAIARRGRIGALLAAWLAGAAIFGAALMLLLDPTLPIRLVGKDVTLTGRTSIWAAVMHQIEKRPATGYGFGAVWDETSRWGPLPWISREQGFVVNEAHDSWLAVWLELGYAGLAGAALMLAHVWARTVIGAFRRRSAYFFAPFVAIFSLHTITESTFLDQNDLIWVMFVATAMKLAMPEDDPASQTYSAYRATR
jgi:exopolysaccharide production protein ExoQ